MLATGELIELKSPDNVTLKISYNGTVYDLLVVQAISYRIDESKKPIYGFHDRHYHKVLAGKAIASGSIAIKKYSKDALIGIIKANDHASLRSMVAKSVSDKVDLIYELISSDLSVVKANSASSKDSYAIKAKKFAKSALLIEVAKRVKKITEQLDAKTVYEDDLLVYGNNNFEMKLLIKFDEQSEYYMESGQDDDEPANTVVFTNLQFISKQTNVVAGQTSIDDVYEFIANVETKERR